MITLLDSVCLRAWPIVEPVQACTRLSCDEEPVKLDVLLLEIV